MPLGPLAAVAVSRALARQLGYDWTARILFLPALLGVEWLLVSLMIWGSKDDGDGNAALMLAPVPALIVSVMSVALYYGAWAAKAARVLMGKIVSSHKPVSG